jgi:hypothetical protein
VSGFRRTLVLSLFITASHARVLAQTAGLSSGPVRGLSTNAGSGSGPVRGSVGGGSLNSGPLSGRPVRGSVTGDVVSGSFSDISAGPVTADNPMAGGGTVGQASAGAVKKDLDSPLGQMISAPLHDLGPLQDRLRAIQPIPRNGPAPDEVAPPAEDTTDTGAAPEPATEANEPVGDIEGPEDVGEPSAIAPEQDGESDAATQQEDDAQGPLEEPAATPASGTPQIE